MILIKLFLKNKIINYNNYKSLINILYYMNINKFNYLLFDYDYKYLYNLYFNMYSFNNLLKYKKYFFVNPVYFSLKHFIMLYNNFLIDFNIQLILIFNFKNIIPYSHDLLSLDIMFFFIKDYYQYQNADYFFFIQLNKINKFYLLLLFNHIFIISLNNSFYKNKILFLNFFKNFICF